MGYPANSVISPTTRMKSADAFAHPRPEKRVKELSSAASLTGSGLCRASSRSGSFMSHRYGGMVDEVPRGPTGFSPVIEEASEWLWTPLYCDVDGLYFKGQQVQNTLNRLRNRVLTEYGPYPPPI